MNHVIFAAICAWAIAQLIKTGIFIFKNHRINFGVLTGPGGMPSSHSAIVCGLAASVFIVDGFASTTFAIALILALVVMYDAAGLRRSMGNQAAVVNRIVRELKEHRPLADFGHDLRELLGHTGIEVIAGALLGVVVASLWFLFIAW